MNRNDLVVLVKKVIFVLLALSMMILTAKCASALPNLSVSIPSSFDVHVGQDYFFNMTLANIGDVPLYNLTFTPLRSTYFPNITNMSSNSSSNYLVRISPVEVFDESYVMKFSYYYYLTEIPAPRIIDVSFDLSSFIPDSVDLYVGDTIRFTNDDDVPGVIKDYNDSFSLSIDVGGSDSHVFTAPGDYVVYHQARGFVLNVHVNNNSVGTLAHSNSLDVVVPVRIVSTYPAGELVINVVTDDMIGDFDKPQEGVIEVKNVGSRTIEDINLSCLWAVFEENDFDLSPGLNKIFKFNATPFNITKTIMTNLTHNVIVNATSKNAFPAYDSFDFFVNYHNFYEIATGNYTITSVLLSAEESIALCSQNPSYPGCDKLMTEKPIEKIIEKEATHEVSESDVKANMDAIGNVDDGFERMENRYKVIEGDVSALNSNMSLLTSVADDLNERLKKSDRNNLIRNIVFWVLFIVISGSTATILIIRWYQYHKEVYEMENEG